MTDPVSFTSFTPRYDLPLLFSGQAGKEFTVNEAHARTDALMHPAIEGELTTPPISPDEGECWLVSTGATGAWVGEDGKLACFEAGNWLFVAPRDGFAVLDKSTGQTIRFAGGWRIAEPPAAPTGGTTTDAEARAAIVDLIDALRMAGVFAAI